MNYTNIQFNQWPVDLQKRVERSSIRVIGIKYTSINPDEEPSMLYVAENLGSEDELISDLERALGLPSLKIVMHPDEIRTRLESATKGMKTSEIDYKATLVKRHVIDEILYDNGFISKLECERVAQIEAKFSLPYNPTFQRYSKCVAYSVSAMFIVAAIAVFFRDC